jgi:hypothetical protein
MTELSDESRALLEAEGPLDEPTGAEIDAMHQRVVAALGPLALPQPPAADPSPLAGKAAAGKVVAAKAAAAGSLKLISGVVVAAVGTGALLFALNQPAPQEPAVAQPAPVLTQPQPAPVALPPAPEANPEPAPEASPPPVLAPLPRSAKPAAPAASSATPSASEEALLVATAEAQLRAGHPAAALALYERHLSEYPKGALRQESQTGRVIALCGVGRSAEARGYVESFAARHPGSPSALRMQRACGIEP